LYGPVRDSSQPTSCNFDTLHLENDNGSEKTELTEKNAGKPRNRAGDNTSTQAPGQAMLWPAQPPSEAESSTPPKENIVGVTPANSESPRISIAATASQHEKRPVDVSEIRLDHLANFA
jgi:hypothetical protein